MYKSNILKVSCLVTSAFMISIPQTTMAADEATVNVSGWINEGLTYYDDGVGTDTAQLSENGTTLGSRITFSGTYNPENTGLKTGFEYILEPQSNPTPLLSANQTNLKGGIGNSIGVLSSNVHFGGDWGKVTIGLQSMPTDNIAVLADPSGTIWSGISPVFRANGFFIRGVGAGATNTTWGQFVQCLTTPGLGIGIDCNGIYRRGVRYDLPAFGDISVAVGYANDEIYDVALKYANTSGELTTNVNVGYAINKDGGTNVGGSEADVLQVQAGVMHSGSGLFGLVTYATESADNATAGSGDDTDAMYFKFGIKKGWSDIGKTAYYGELGLYNDQYGLGNTDGVSGSEVQRIGLGVTQDVGARLKFYAKWESLSLDVEGTAAAQALYSGAKDLDIITFGTTYFF